ncbi:uncharacterized protein MELLADRAFT_88020 [Melampsora larici-populina 98AG31]|uniref:AMP-dependent synthetase/ligase domain-containing protein n=1 Tax=Melampsora larici-populina (strain 98AG31 / pathotype 3-4-7) TaxID=747676 RepID=F4RQ47_MELLP|nr:uncharacterized protein MELLADRAFT_88020 [Melampsora larici-populina 98AG31]EGG05347.1 hypothetical protein MELLADRAFT_88020 [Melampsora larici-populina 98AG31]
MTSAQRIYPSLFGSLPYLPKEQNAWDFLISNLPEGSLSSSEAFGVDVLTGVTRTLSETVERVECLAKALVRHVNKSGSMKSVGILSPNHLDYPVIIYACLASGIPVAPISATASALETRHLSKLGQCEIIFVHPKCLANIKEAGYPFEKIVLIEPSIGWNGPTLEDFVKMGETMTSIKSGGIHPTPLHEVAVILFSSGSTGNPKAVMLTHRNICSALQATMIMTKAGLEAMAKINPNMAPQLPARPVVLVFLPMNHAFGLMTGVLRAIISNAVVCIMPKWDFLQAMQAIPKYKVTTLAMVPAIATQILAHPQVLQTIDLSSLTAVYVGASAISVPQKQALLKLLASRGARGGDSDESTMPNGYGMSEYYYMAPARPGTIGVLLPGLEARIISDESDSASGIDAPLNTAGELWLRGPMIMKGYLNNEIETKNALTEDGWFKTGDKIRMESDGQMFYVDRIKDTFKNRGLQVAPSEISSLILNRFSDLIADIAVIGIPSSESKRDIGEEAWVFIVLTPKGRENHLKKQIGKEIQELVKRTLSKHKWVAQVRVMDEFPKGHTHKVLVREIRDQALRSINENKLKSKL